jgi:acetyl esterase
MRPRQESISGPSRDYEQVPLPRGLDPASLKLLDQLKGIAFPEDVSISEARRQMREGGTSGLLRPSLTRVSVRHENCEIEIVRRRSLSGSLPVLFFFHGGGWVMGDEETHAYLIGELAERSRWAIAFVHYPLAPEVQYPTGQDNAFEAICEVLSRAEDHRIDPTRFALAGDSAGGNIAAALALRFCQHGPRAPRLQILLYPALDAGASSESHRIFSQGLNLTGRTMRWFWNQYAPELDESHDPFLSPLWAPDEMLRRLPTTLIITSEFDILRDEGEQYAARLREAGVSTTAVRFGGVLHAFMVTELLAKSPAGKLAIALLCSFLRLNSVKSR